MHWPISVGPNSSGKFYSNTNLHPNITTKSLVTKTKLKINKTKNHILVLLHQSCLNDCKFLWIQNFTERSQWSSWWFSVIVVECPVSICSALSWRERVTLICSKIVLKMLKNKFCYQIGRWISWDYHKIQEYPIIG
jgi:hypothetical protein